MRAAEGTLGGNRVLVTAPYFQRVLERFRPELEALALEVVAPPVVERMGEEELLAHLDGVVGAICGDDAFTRRVLERAKDLRVISKWGTGIDSIDQEACRELGIQVRNTPGAFSAPVADSVLAYVLCFARRVHEMNDAMRAGRWHKLDGVSLHERTLGVVGVGNVGREVIRRAAAFGMRVLANDIRPLPADFLAQHGVTLVDKESLFSESDFVSLNCDLNPTSRHLVGAALLARMKDTAVLINTARGSIVDEAALARALETGRPAGAALDVFEREPLPADSALRRLPGVMLAPHNSNSSPAAWERVHRATLANLLDGLSAARR